MTISKHAQERYAERIMDREHPTDVAVFIRDHEDKIQRDIEKMIEFGKPLYKGKSFKDPSRSVCVTLNGAWVVIWDSDESVVITLYCIDLGVGDDVNKAFISNALQQIEEAQDEFYATVARTDEMINTYKGIIENGEATLSHYRKVIRDVEAQINGCKQMIASASADNDVANDRLREKVEILIGRKRF